MRRPATLDNPYRLTPSVTPLGYKLLLEPDLAAASFTGHVRIDLEVGVATTSITLNALELRTEPATVRSQNQEQVSANPRCDEEHETVTFDFAREVGPGPVTIEIDFSGVLNDELHGFYRSTYMDPEGVIQTIATTQFAATDARRAFPCFDDPAQKATFEVTLVVPSDLAAVSNSAEIGVRELPDGRREVRFAPTMVMSTYLVAFVVGPFEATPERIVLGVPTRVIYPRGKGHLAGFALDVLDHALSFFSDYFERPYPGDKIDMVAVPDFAFGAMENLGCITFREERLLVDPATASHEEIQWVARAVNHEAAHMWFGDLVTMDWWEGIWLNEAVASFLEGICTDHFRPDWRRWENFASERDAAFDVDAQHTTRAIEYRVVSPEECAGMFDVLTYAKGCSVLRMLEQYLGEPTFRAGIQLYLSRHAHDNAVTADLWSALETASGEPVGSIMNTWILQGGFPLLSLEGSSLSQKPFFFLSTEGVSNIGAEWKVPALVRTLDSPDVGRVLVEGEPSTVLQGSSVIVNAGGSGFYRTAYTSTHLAELSNRLSDLDGAERAVLASDTWACVLLGRYDLSDLLKFAWRLRDFEESAPWGIISRSLTMVDRLVDDGAREDFTRVVRVLLSPLQAHLGWRSREGESSQVAVLRARVLQDLGTLGRDGHVAAEAVRLFDANELEGNLADAIVTITMQQDRSGDPATCEERRLRASTPQEELRYLLAPAASCNSVVVLDALERAFDGVRTQDAPSLIAALLGNRNFGPQVWRRLTERWDEAIERFAVVTHSTMVVTVSTLCGDPELARSVRTFLESHPLPTAQRTVAQYLDVLDVNVAWAQRTSPTLAQVLKDFLEWSGEAT